MKEKPDSWQGSDADVPPLTSAGPGSRPYKRRDDIEAQIRAAVSLPPEEWTAHLSLRGGWANETRVHLLRRIRASNPHLFGKLLETLMKRIGPIAERWAQGFDQTDLEHITDGVAIKIVERILATTVSPQSEILEVCFAEIVKRETLKEVAKRNARSEISQPAPVKENDEGDVLDPVSEIKDERPDPLAELIKHRERDPTLREILKAVSDPRHRRAFILHEIRKWPYQPGDPPRPCLCKLFNKSERRIRSWIGIAREQMQAALGDRT